MLLALLPVEVLLVVLVLVGLKSLSRFSFSMAAKRKKKMIRDYSGKIEEVIMVTDEERLLSGVENKEKTPSDECVMSTWTCITFFLLTLTASFPL